MNRSYLTAVGFVTGGAAVGSITTYFAVRRHFKAKYEAYANEEIDSVKARYVLPKTVEERQHPAQAMKAYSKKLDELEYSAEDAIVDAVAEKVVGNLEDDIKQSDEMDLLRRQLRAAMGNRDFQQIDDLIPQVDETERFDELKARDPHKPLEITKEDFFDDSNEFDKLTITYYEGDEVLTDDREQVIRDIEGVVGRDNLTRFGNNSGDMNIVYVRNETLQVDYEVVLDKGEYIEKVLGIRTESSSAPRRMRDDE